jgi:hypothetical protein
MELMMICFTKHFHIHYLMVWHSPRSLSVMSWTENVPKDSLLKPRSPARGTIKKILHHEDANFIYGLIHWWVVHIWPGYYEVGTGWRKCVTGMSLKVSHSWPLPLSFSLSISHKVSSFILPHVPTMILCVTMAQKQWRQVTID